ncbi:MAG: Hsp70 family protein [Pseudomonadales bacterium]
MTEQCNSIGVGLDFGTSNSAAAWFDGRTVHKIHLETGLDVTPTAVHLNRELVARTGSEAIVQYIEENRDRIVELTPEVVAHASLLTGEATADDPFSQPEISTSAVYGAAVIDRGLPGRLFRGVKRLIGQVEIKRLMVFDHPFRLVALMTPMLKAMRVAIDASIPALTHQIVIGRPVHFEGAVDADRVALKRLREAAEYARLAPDTFYPEPLAATLSYLHARNRTSLSAGAAGMAFTFDFGGGTLDLSRVRYQGVEMTVLGTSGLALGGDHIDQLMFKRFVSPELGQGERWVRRVDGEVVDTEFPFKEFEPLLLNWPVTYTLNQNKYRSKLRDGIAGGGAAAVKFARLEELIAHNHGYRVFQAIRRAKADLSTVELAVIDVPEIDLMVEVHRASFDGLLEDLRLQITELIETTLSAANVVPEEVDLVVRTGGSSLIAMVQTLLDDLFPGKVVEHDPFSSVAEGLAIASFYGLRSSSETGEDKG